MKRTLIALAVGAAFVAPAAYADVTLSGSINMGLELLKVGSVDAKTPNSIRGAASAESLTTTGVSTNYSNVTIGSMEDLGGGLKLDFAYQLTAPTNGNNGVSNRNSHIGLVGDSWGGVWYGSNENIYERYLYTVDPLDGAAGLGGNLAILGNPGAGRVFDAVSGNQNCGTAAGVACGRAGFYRRDEQVLWYDSPNWSGFTFGAALGTNYAKTAGGTNPSQWQVGAKYVGPTIPIQVWGAYAQHKDYFGLLDITANTGGGAAGTSSKDKAFQLGVGYTLGDIFLFGNFEQLKYNTDGLAAGVTEYKRNAYSLGLKWNVATGYIGAQYIQAMDGKCEQIGGGCNASDTGAKMIGVGYYHTMSKQTQLWAILNWLDNKDLGNYKTAGIGNAAAGSNIGATYTGVGVGIKHSF